MPQCPNHGELPERNLTGEFDGSRWCEQCDWWIGPDGSIHDPWRTESERMPERARRNRGLPTQHDLFAERKEIERHDD